MRLILSHRFGFAHASRRVRYSYKLDCDNLSGFGRELYYAALFQMERRYLTFIQVDKCRVRERTIEPNFRVDKSVTNIVPAYNQTIAFFGELDGRQDKFLWLDPNKGLHSR